MLDHTALLALITGILGALALFAVKVFGEPGARMAHRKALEEIEAKAEIAREKAHARLADSWERRAETLETRQALLDASNRALRERIDELERQVARAGNIHVADLATIANLRQELDAHVAELTDTRADLAERDARIAALEARVAELEEALGGRQPSGKAKPAPKKKGRKNV